MADDKPAEPALVKDIDGAPTPQATISQPRVDSDADIEGNGGEDSATLKRKMKASKTGQRPECFRTTVQEVLFVFMATIGLATSTFLTGTTIIVTAAIGKDLGMSQGQITWTAAAPTLTAGAFQLALGQLADLLGRKAMFLFGMGCFSICSLIAAFAQNPFWADILCGILGLASAMVVPPAIGILGAAYSVPSRRKNWAFAAFSAGNPLGFAMGSIAGGIAARIFDWRASFILLAIIWAVMAVASIWVVPGNVEAFEPAPFKERLKIALEQFDLVGTMLTVLGVGLLTAALTLGPSDGWKTGHVIAMLIVGFALLVAFIFWESYWEHPLMPLHIWRDKTFCLLVAVVLFGIMSFNSSNFWLALFMQEIWSYDALKVAVHLLPQVIAGIIWNVVAASILHKVNNTIITGVAALAYLGANLLLTFQKAHTTYWAFIFPSLIANVIGADFQFNVANMYVMQALPTHQQSLAGGIFNMLIRLGSTISLGISTAVYSSVKEAQGRDGDENTPFRMAYFVSVGLAALGFLFVPFLRIGTQGNSPDETDVAKAGLVKELPKDNGVLDETPASWEKEDEERRTITGSDSEKQ
ncbi:major facilitator superfamily domain-containing protein [Mariannaea sp. PMI_226]|nr:major facilitator superfamily domain-containing protein [Mariannaea sp. PMI_226]